MLWIGYWRGGEGTKGDAKVSGMSSVVGSSTWMKRCGAAEFEGRGHGQQFGLSHTQFEMTCERPKGEVNSVGLKHWPGLQEV